MDNLRKFTDLRPEELSIVVEKYMGGSSGVAQHSRSQSWDFCYDHFSDLERVMADRQASCMQLGYYLASWGMLRGRGYLFKKTNARHYLDALRVIEDYDDDVRGVTPSQFGERHIQDLLLEVYKDLNSSLLPEGGQSLTLVTKTMMGVWGVFPSLDTYFNKTFKDFAKAAGLRGVFHRFSRKTIHFVGEFYDEHRDEIDTLTDGYRTVNFETGLASSSVYPAAKVIDIYGFNAAFNPL